MTKRLSDITGFGATAEERSLVLPGDEIIAAPLLQTTQAITIDAAPATIWRWLVQIGAGRAGFYSDSPFWDACVDLYYRGLARGQHRAPMRHELADARIVPAWQGLKVGDRTIPM